MRSSESMGAGSHESSNLSRTILDNILEGCQIIDREWKYVYVNDSIVAQGKSTREELLGHTMMEVYPGIENTELFVSLRNCMESRIPQRFENNFMFPDGSSGCFELSIEPVDEGILILSIDITARKRGEESLKKQLRNMAALREIDLAIAGSLDLKITLSIALEQVLNRLEVSAAAVLLVNSETGFLDYAGGKGFIGQEIASSQLKVGGDLTKEAVFNRKLVSVQNLASHSGFLRGQLLAEEKFVSYHCAPIIAKGEVIGVLELFERQQVDHKTDWFEFLEMLAGQIAIGVDSYRLFNNLQKANRELLVAYDATIEGWSRALDLRDQETEGHTLRVTNVTMRLARRMGLSDHSLSDIRRGALLHDIGKMGVPDHILLKPGSLSPEEWVSMKQHPVFAYNLLLKIDYLSHALDIPHYHHEKWDGSGYPMGLSGGNIPFPARLFATVDVWDALRSNRPYRKGLSFGETMTHIRNGAGTHFDPAVVHEFLELMRDGDEQFRTTERV